jgi:hypothetical protein
LLTFAGPLSPSFTLLAMKCSSLIKRFSLFDLTERQTRRYSRGDDSSSSRFSQRASDASARNDVVASNSNNNNNNNDALNKINSPSLRVPATSGSTAADHRRVSGGSLVSIGSTSTSSRSTRDANNNSVRTAALSHSQHLAHHERSQQQQSRNTTSDGNTFAARSSPKVSRSRAQFSTGSLLRCCSAQSETDSNTAMNAVRSSGRTGCNKRRSTSQTRLEPILNSGNGAESAPVTSTTTAIGTVNRSLIGSRVNSLNKNAANPRNINFDCNLNDAIRADSNGASCVGPSIAVKANPNSESVAAKLVDFDLRDKPDESTANAFKSVQIDLDGQSSSSGRATNRFTGKLKHGNSSLKRSISIGGLWSLSSGAAIGCGGEDRHVRTACKHRFASQQTPKERRHTQQWNVAADQPMLIMVTSATQEQIGSLTSLTIDKSNRTQPV